MGGGVGDGRAALRFGVLGPLEVRRGDERVEPRSQKPRVLLIALLLHHGRPVPAEQLIDAVWGEHPPATASGVLQNYISQLRKALGADVVRRETAGYVLDVSSEQLDLTQFERLVAAAASARHAPAESGRLARQALALWRGDPLVDVAYEQFAQAEVARLRELHGGALELHAESEVASGRPGSAVAVLEPAVTEHPMRERLWALLMLALYADHRQAEALAAYQRARSVLVESLGIEPGTALRRIETAILAQLDPRELLAAEVGVARARPAKQDVPAEPVLGRDEECTLIEERLMAPAHPARLVVFSGESGIGKSRLLQEARAQCEGRGGTAVTGRAFEAEQRRSYGAWSDALRGVRLPGLTDALRRDLSPLVPELCEERVELDDAGRLYDAVVAALDRLAEAGTTAVILDDLQWLDEQSVALLHYVIRRVSGDLAFFASARPAELEANVVALRVVQALRRDDLLDDVPVGPLPAGVISELTRPIAPDADAASIAGIAEASGGNPLFALEMARAVARGDQPLSDRLDALIGDRLSRLGPEAGAIVPWLAAFGRSVDATLLAVVTEREPAELARGLDDLEGHDLVQLGPAGAYDFVHDLVRAAAYRRLSTPRRTMMHSRIGALLAGLPDPDDVLAVDAVRHADAGGDSQTCAAACVRAARRSLRLFAYPEAEQYVELGRAHAAKLAEEERVPIDLQLVQVLLHPGLRLHEPGPLVEELTELCAGAQRLGREADLTVGLYLLARAHHWGWGDIPRAKALMQHAVDVISAATGPTVEPLLECARCLAYIELDMPRTYELFEQLLGLGQLVEASHQYQWGLGLVQAWAGNVDEARASMHRAIELARRHGDHWAVFECSARLALLELESGDVASARALSETLGELAAKLGPAGSEPVLSRAIAALASGADAAADFEEAAAELERIDAKFLLPDLLGLAAETALRAGEEGRALSYAERALAVSRQVDRPSEAARASALLALVAARHGSLDEARARLERDAVDAAALPQHVAALRREAAALAVGG